jgi:hypothetical protein
MNPIEAFRALSLGAVVVISAINVVELAVRVRPAPIDPPLAMADPAARQETRFAGLLKAVRVHQVSGIVGYMAGFSGGRLLDDPAAAEDYFRAQFALLPLVLDPEAGKHDWAVANFRAPEPDASTLKGWRTLEDFGDGVLLLHRSEP